MLEMLKNTQNVTMNVLRYFIVTYVKITSTKSELFCIHFPSMEHLSCLKEAIHPKGSCLLQKAIQVKNDND